MILYKLRTWLADHTADHAAAAALRYAGITGAMLSDIDMAITCIDDGNYPAARRILQDTINIYGENCRAHLDNYQPPLIVVDTPLIAEQEVIDIAYLLTEGTDPRD